jgi:hypothetical protein
VDVDLDELDEDPLRLPDPEDELAALLLLWVSEEELLSSEDALEPELLDPEDVEVVVPVLLLLLPLLV